MSGSYAQVFLMSAVGVSFVLVLLALAQYVPPVNGALRGIPSVGPAVMDFAQSKALWLYALFVVLLVSFAGVRYMNKRNDKARAAQEAATAMIPYAVKDDGGIDARVMGEITKKCETHLTPAQCSAITAQIRDLAQQKQKEILGKLSVAASGGG